MSRKKDPIIGVVDYFETASLEAAQSALALAQAIVRRRTPAAEKKGKRTRSVKPATSTPPPAPPAPAAPAGEKRRRQRTVATAPAAATGELELALPGLGPATVGD